MSAVLRQGCKPQQTVKHIYWGWCSSHWLCAENWALITGLNTERCTFWKWSQRQEVCLTSSLLPCNTCSMQSVRNGFSREMLFSNSWSTLGDKTMWGVLQKVQGKYGIKRYVYLGMLTSHTREPRFRFLLLIQISASALGPCHLHGRPKLSSWLLAAQP